MSLFETTIDRSLPPATGPRSLLAVGTPEYLRRAMTRAGWDVYVHDLDLGPAADLAGRPFTPPVKRWPQSDADFDVVLLYDQLAHVVDDEAAIAEAARVLKPGGQVLIRVPRAGLLAWLDSFNLFRYLRDFTKRGEPQPETRGIGWRRHYSRRDLTQLLGVQFRVTAVASEGIGLTEIARLTLLLLFRWLLRRPHTYDQLRPLLGPVARLDNHLNLGPLGYHLIIVAERRPAPAADTDLG